MHTGPMAEIPMAYLRIYAGINRVGIHRKARGNCMKKDWRKKIRKQNNLFISLLPQILTSYSTESFENSDFAEAIKAKSLWTGRFS